MLRTAIAVGILAAVHMLTACASTLDQQRRMADLAEAALVHCRQDRSVCRAAKLCSSRAAEAAKAIQDARRAAAEGRGDVGMDLDATLLASGAEALCERAGVTAKGNIVAVTVDGGGARDGGARDGGTSAAVAPSPYDISSRVSPDLSTPPPAAPSAAPTAAPSPTIH